MSKRDQLAALSSTNDTHTGKPLPEGFEQLITSAGNVLGFHGAAEKFRYLKANPSQFVNNGEGDVRGH